MIEYVLILKLKLYFKLLIRVCNRILMILGMKKVVRINGLKNINDVIKFVPLNPATREMLQELFITKYYMLKDAGDSAERKSIVTQSITSKLQSSLDAATFNKIKSNKVLFESLVN